MDIPFVLRDLRGRVNVRFGVNEDPGLVGAMPQSAGFPMCGATVDYPGRGYDAVLGWVQLVRCDDNESDGRDFEIDPLEFLGDLPHPFCWVGLNPELFDAPSRRSRSDLDWLAHSFLCVPDGSAHAALLVEPLVGFAWGFRIRDEQIHLIEPTLLGPADWEQHRAGLAARFPACHFVDGFR